MSFVFVIATSSGNEMSTVKREESSETKTKFSYRSAKESPSNEQLPHDDATSSQMESSVAECIDHKSSDSNESRVEDESIEATTSQTLSPNEDDISGCEGTDKSSDCNSQNSSPTQPNESHDHTITDAVRKETQKIIEQYFYRLTVGCGNSNCTNLECASNPNVEPLPPNQAAARALCLYAVSAKLCSAEVESSPR